jgi:hypothetical protein
MTLIDDLLYLFKNPTDISNQNIIFAKDVDAPTDCIGTRNSSVRWTGLEIAFFNKGRVAPDRPTGYAEI